jgi:hypothetical protein
VNYLIVVAVRSATYFETSYRTVRLPQPDECDESDGESATRRFRRDGQLESATQVGKARRTPAAAAAPAAASRSVTSHQSFSLIIIIILSQ